MQKNYNDWLHDYAGAANGRLFGLAAIPVQDPQAAAREIDRVLESGASKAAASPAPRQHSGRTSTTPTSRSGRAPRRPASRSPCTSARIPHVPRERRVSPWRRDAIADYAATQATVQRTIVEFLCRGVCERHPRLKIVVAEFNAGWIAHWLDRVGPGAATRTPQHGRAVHRPAASRSVAPAVLRHHLRTTVRRWQPVRSSAWTI